MTSYIMERREGNLKLSYRTETMQGKIGNWITIIIKEVNKGFLAYLGYINFIR